MNLIKTDLSKYNNEWYKPGKNIVVRGLWYITNAVFFISPLFPFSGIKKIMLRLYGARIGKGVVIKPSVNIKYPWRLKIGDYSWIGEKVWIDNLADVEIGDNVSISQGAILLCGNHNFKKSTFDLMIGKIIIEDGVWIGAKTVVTGDVTCFSHSILTAGSVASKNLDSYCIYKGNPAVFIKKREVTE
ncbi:MAG: WcaF family extracellular polysaccharide biosynthesis acetyltransferase [Bacteroidales bacterium]|nr:WcaF family extracellular polysaccharide biosynthesis acetyltransferase [Bacteroidales bacterium]